MLAEIPYTTAKPTPGAVSAAASSRSPSAGLIQVDSSRTEAGYCFQLPMRRHTTSSPYRSTMSRPSASPKTVLTPWYGSGPGGASAVSRALRGTSPTA